jgi:hypothetical protein
VCFILTLKGDLTPLHFGEKPAKLQDDAFDPSLMRLNTMAKLEDYCDSFFQANISTRTYPGVVSEVVRLKFYHGSSYYDATHNPLATFVSSIVKKGMAAIVVPDDIVKYPYAACSQQSMVCMDMLKRRGYKVRKVTMWDDVNKLGHFAFESFYDNSWHFFDTNMEPDNDVLRTYNRPSVAFLNQHPDIIAAAYRKKDPALFQRLLLGAQFGPINESPAPVASLFQATTKFMSYFGWILIGLFMLVRYLVLTRKAVFSFIKLRGRQGHYQPIGRSMQGHEARA